MGNIFKISKARRVAPWITNQLICNVLSTRKCIFYGNYCLEYCFLMGVTWLGNWASDPCSLNMAMPTSPKLQKRGFVAVFWKCASQQITVWAACEIAGLGLKSARVLCEIFPSTANKCCITGGVNIVVKIEKEKNVTKIDPCLVKFYSLLSLANLQDSKF